jgi:N-methylhydantoinase B
MFANTYLIGTKYPMRGFNGGRDGSPNSIVLRAGTAEELRVASTAFVEPLSTDDLSVAELGGGGGWGDPLERDPEAVREDVLDEYVSPEGARRDYGVVIDTRTGEVDREATRKLRQQMAAKSTSRR